MTENEPAETESSAKLLRLALYLLEAKHEEDLARKHRIEIEERIAALVPGPDKGAKTVKLEDGSRVTVERGLNYKADIQEIERLFREHHNSIIPPIKSKTTYELDTAGYEWFRVQQPAVFAEIAKHVVVTPRKTAVSVRMPK